MEKLNLNTGLFRRWPLFLVTTLTLFISIAYIITHQYPSGLGGFYLQVSNEILTEGILPARVPNYTETGLPFAYQPLGFWLVAGVVSVGVSPLSALVILPAVYLVFMSISAYILIDRIHNNNIMTAFSLTLFIAAPHTLFTSLVGTSVTHNLAVIFIFLGLSLSIDIFRLNDDEKRSHKKILAIGILFGLLATTHPKYTLYFIYSMLFFYLFFDRSISGIIDGIYIGIIGIFVTIPWLSVNLTRYGIKPYLYASNTQGGFVSDPVVIIENLSRFIYPDSIYISIPFLIAVLGAPVLLSRYEKIDIFIILWLVISLLLLDTIHTVFCFSLISGKILANILSFVKRLELKRVRGVKTSVIVSVIIILALFAPALLTVTYPTHQIAGIQSSISESGVESAEYLNSISTPDETFVAVRDKSATFVPYLSNRTMLRAPWGAEWINNGKSIRDWYLSGFIQCADARCISSNLKDKSLSPNYVWVSFEDDVGHGCSRDCFVDSLNRSNQYQIIYEREEHVIAEYYPNSTLHNSSVS